MAEYIDENILDPNEYDHVVFDDGKMYLYNSDSDYEEITHFSSAEDWISHNEAALRDTYNDLKSFHLGQQATFPDFCEYMSHASSLNLTDFDVWTEEADKYAVKLYGIHNSRIKEFAAHYYFEILNMYKFIERNSGLCVGLVEDFVSYLYDYSEHRLI